METLFYILCLLVTAMLLFLSIYFIITLSDLECDYLNATECCDRLNIWVIPRIVGVGILIMLYLILGNWYLAASNIAFISYLIYQKIKKCSLGHLGVYDATEIHNMGQVRHSIQQCLMIVAWLLLNFFLNMYLGILSILKEDELDVAALSNDEILYNSSAS